MFTFAPEAEGHGTDAAIAAYHFHEGQIRARVPWVKLVASALTIGTGGSGGREGPIAQIGATSASDRLTIRGATNATVVDAAWEDLKSAWQAPLAWG